MSLAAVAGCAPVAPAATSQKTAAAGSTDKGQTGDSSSGTSGDDAANPACTKATKVTITGSASGGGYAFSPSKLTIQRGGFLAIINESDAVHTLATAPEAGIVTSVLDKQERQVIQFPQKGQFAVESADATHRAVLRLTVSGDNGCGAPEPTLTITGAAAGHYRFSPSTLKVPATQNFAVVNKSNTAHTVVCTPDPGGNGDNSKLDEGETQLLAIDKPGKYLCNSFQHSNAKVTITVS